MAKKVYVVKALAALVNSEGGFAQLLQRGAILPSNADPVQLQHLLDNDIVEEGVLVGGLEPVYTGDLTEQVTTRGDGVSDPDVAPDDPDGDGPMPAKSASRADWDAFAKSEAGGSLSDEDLKAFSSKEDLQKHYEVS
jgi:hypothetical protein